VKLVRSVLVMDRDAMLRRNLWMWQVEVTVVAGSNARVTMAR